MKHNGIVFTSM